MKLYVITAKNEAAGPPWVVTAWDEYTVDENGSGYEGAITDAMRLHGAENVRIGIVHVPENFLESLFEPVEVTATKVEKA
jgi:hypothetical protein